MESAHGDIAVHSQPHTPGTAALMLGILAVLRLRKLLGAAG
jgi:hypothetical protein